MPEEKGSRPGNSPRRKQNTNRKQGIAVPMGSVILEKFTLQTRTGVRIWNVCSHLSSDLRLLQDRLAGNMSAKEFQSVEDVVNKDLSDLKNRAQEQLATINDQIKNLELPKVEFAKQDVEVNRTCPSFKTLIEAVLLVDRICMKVEALWLAGSLSSVKRAEAIANWEKSFRAMASNISRIIAKTRREVGEERDERMKKREEQVRLKQERRAQRRAEEEKSAEDDETSEVSEQAKEVQEEPTSETLQEKEKEALSNSPQEPISEDKSVAQKGSDSEAKASEHPEPVLSAS